MQCRWSHMGKLSPIKHEPLRTLPVVQNNSGTPLPAHWEFLPVRETRIYQNPTPLLAGTRSTDSLGCLLCCLVLKSFLLHNLIDCAGRRIPCNTLTIHIQWNGARVETIREKKTSASSTGSATGSLQWVFYVQDFILITTPAVEITCTICTLHFPASIYD